MNVDTSDAVLESREAPGWATSAPILAAVLIPLATMLVFAAVVIMKTVEHHRSATRLFDQVERATQASRLAHELQKERGMSAGFVGSGGAAFGSELAEQRRLTDAALQTIGPRMLVRPEDASGASFARFETRSETLREAYAALAEMRARVDASEATVPELAGFYTGLINALLSVADDALVGGERIALARDLEIYRSLLNAKEFGGLERAAGAVGFGSGGFAPAVYERFISLQARQSYLFDRIRDIGDDEARAALDAALTAPASVRIAALRETARENVAGGDLGGVDGPTWFAASTAYLGELYRFEQTMAGALQARAAAVASAAATNFYLAVGLAGVSLIAGIGILFGYVRPLISALRDLAASIRLIEAERQDVVVAGAARRDEVGVVARALSRIRDQGVTASRLRETLLRARLPIAMVKPDGGLHFSNGAFGALMKDKGAAFGVSGDPAEDVGGLMKSLQAAERRGAKFTNPMGDEKYELEADGAVLEVGVHRLGADAPGASTATVLMIEDVTSARALERDVRTAFEAVRRGDLDVRVSQIDDRGFASFAARGLNEILDTIRSFIAALDDVLSRMSRGDLSAEIAADFAGGFAAARDGVNHNVRHFRDTFADVATMAGAVDAAAAPLAEDAKALSDRAATQADALRDTRDAVDAIAASARESAMAAERATATSRDASRRAAGGGEVVDRAVEAMRRIEESAGRITDITGVINSIAFQTNLLALNAAVEAARAGDAGKGFAVVASEVRTLAQRSADAARDIEGLLSTSASHVADGAKLVNETGDALRAIAEAVENCGETVATIDQAAALQAERVEGVRSAIGSLDQLTNANAETAERSARTSNDLARQAGEMTDLVARFQGGQTDVREDASVA